MKILLSAYLVMLTSMAVYGQENGNKRSFKRPEPGKEAPFNVRMIIDLPYNIDFPVDSNTQTGVGKRYDSILVEHPKLDKDFDFRFQLKQYYMLANHDNVFVLTLKNNNWKAQYFTTDVKPTADNKRVDIRFIEELNLDQSGVDQLWELLVLNNLLKLPGQRIIDEKMVEYVIDSTSFQISQRRLYMADGVLYEFDLQKPGKQRHYWYTNPLVYFKQYPHVMELAQVVANISLIRKFLMQPVSSF